MKRLLLAAAAALAFATPAAAVTLVTADRMLDVTTGRYVDRPAIVVGDDGRIQQIGNLASLQVPAGARHIDLAGRTLIPGLIDMHVHLDSPADIGGYRGLEFTDSFWQATAVGNAKAMLDAGFTTVRNVGSGNRNDVGLKQAIDNGYAVGPRIVPAGHALGATGGHCDQTFLPPSLQKDEKEEGIGDSPDELRYQVRRQRKFGAEVIKVCATGGVFSRNTEPGQLQVPENELRAIANEAHQWGLRVAAHAHGAEGIKAAIRAGARTIEHASYLDSEGIALAKARGTWLDMDIYNGDWIEEIGTRQGWPAEYLRKNRETTDIQRRGFAAAVKAGVRMTFGTDAGVYPHGLGARQFAYMVRYGMSPMQAIRSATSEAARALGKADVGSVAVGAWGDLVAVRGDPLKDVSVLERVEGVIKGGKQVR